ncbi:MAG TPA: YeiH family protein [Pseudolabrys sp.]|nr:YeiH family protein [Pseudolabrys sp.]
MTALAPDAAVSAAARLRASLIAILPGLALTFAIAAAAFGLRLIPGVSILSPMILAILMGIAFHNVVGTPAIAKPGIAFSLRRILRFAIILLGLQLTAAQVAEVGATGVAIIVVTLVATFLFTKWFGTLIGVDGKLSELIAAGTSICGASAVIATNTVTQGPDEDVAYAVACVTVFGSIAMFVYPLLPGLLHLTPHEYGLWSGASIHEIAQVVAAAYQDGEQAGNFGTIAKLSRVILLAPLVIALGVIASRRLGSASGTGKTKGAAPPLPWFVFGFIALIIVNSLVAIPVAAKDFIVPATAFLLSVALAAMGLETDIAKLRRKGLRPLLLGLAASLFISALSLILIKLVYA